MTKCKKCKAVISAPFADAVAKGGFNNPKRVNLDSLRAEMCLECYMVDKGRVNK